MTISAEDMEFSKVGNAIVSTDSHFAKFGNRKDASTRIDVYILWLLALKYG